MSLDLIIVAATQGSPTDRTSVTFPFLSRALIRTLLFHNLLFNTYRWRMSRCFGFIVTVVVIIVISVVVIIVIIVVEFGVILLIIVF